MKATFPVGCLQAGCEAADLRELGFCAVFCAGSCDDAHILQADVCGHCFVCSDGAVIIVPLPGQIVRFLPELIQVLIVMISGRLKPAGDIGYVCVIDCAEFLER